MEWRGDHRHHVKLHVRSEGVGTRGEGADILSLLRARRLLRAMTPSPEAGAVCPSFLAPVLREFMSAFCINIYTEHRDDFLNPGWQVLETGSQL